MALNPSKPQLEPAYLEKLQDYYAEHKVIPSYSVMASLWGVSAKSWVSQCVKRFEESGYLDWTPDKQLKPGPRFFERRLAHDTVQAGLPQEMAALYMDMSKGFNDGVVKPTQPRTPASTTPTSIEAWAKEIFAPAFRGS